MSLDGIHCSDEEPCDFAALTSAQVSKALKVSLAAKPMEMNNTEAPGEETLTTDEGQTSAEGNHTHTQLQGEARSHDFKPTGEL